MFKSNTVFVVGAGASKEAGLPIGEELTDKIASLLKISVDYKDLQSGDHEIHNAMRRLAQSGPPWNNNQFIASGRAVAEAMELAQSIDTFLETHASNPEFVMLGKMGIARAIAIEERKSLLAPSSDQPFNMRKLGGKWYISLARQLFTGIPVERPETAFEGVSFIVFNYDRCLQVFLIRALEVYFRINSQRAQEIVQKVPIIHPYGSLGTIFEGNRDRVPYAPANLNLIAAAERIRTFSESVDSAASDRIKQMIEQAETLVFLGFGFHEQNMRLLDHGNHQDYDGIFNVRAFATTHGLSDSDTQFIRGQISHLVTGEPERSYDGTWIFTQKGTCAELFSSYWRSLTG